MKAEAVALLRVLQGGRQYTVPIYQRTYSWGKEQVARLWEDVLSAGEAGRAHFTGSLVYVTTTEDDMSDVTEALLIDGQQRLTTTMLLLIALVRRLQQSGGFKVEQNDSTLSVSAESVRKNLLVNADVSGRLHHKLVLTKRDRETLARLIGSLEDVHTPLPVDSSPPVLDALAFFEKRLAAPGVDLATVYAGLQRLQVVRVALKDSEDDPQLIFDSMNSTGLDLTEADRIRNYVLMKFKGQEQDKLYEEQWFPMERVFDGAEKDAFDRFIRDFLSIRSRVAVPARLNEVYAAFKGHVEQDGPADTGDVKVLVRELAQAARYYAALLDPQANEPDSQVRRALLSLRALDLDVWYPLVLDTYAAWQAKDLTTDEFVELLGVLESYLYRRWVCGLGTQGLNKFFPALPAQLRGQPHLQAFKDALYQQRTYLRFPDDDDFRREIMTRDLYARRHFSRYTLGRLENWQDKEPINPSDYTIEHVLPQNKALRQEWRDMLGANWGEIQARYLHTLGNLTLTGYNSEYGDRPFAEKRDMPKGFKESHLSLNQELSKLSEWNEKRILERAERLAARAMSIWPMVQPSDELIERLAAPAEKSGYTLDSHLAGLEPALRVLVDEVREGLLGLHADVQEVPTKTYVAYKVGTNFCDLVPQPEFGRVKCWLNLPFTSLDDPHGLARDVSEIGHQGNGEAEVVVGPGTSLEVFLDLAQQALNYQLARQEGVEAQMAVLPQEVQNVLAALNTRLTALEGVTRKVNKWTLTYRRSRLFAELVPRKDHLTLRIRQLGKAPDAGIWTATRWPNWWQTSLSTTQELEAAWPAVLAAYTQHGKGSA